MIGLIAIVGIYFLKYNVKSVPVGMLWLYRNYSARMFSVGEDLGGIFLKIVGAGGKKLETIQATGVPIEVDMIDNKGMAYYIEGAKGSLDQKVQDFLLDNGFRVRVRKEKRKTIGYLIERPPLKERKQVYLDVAGAGGLKRQRLYATVQGTGETIDWMKVVDDEIGHTENAPIRATTSLLHQEEAAAKAWLTRLAEAGQSSLKALLLPGIAFFTIGAMITLMGIIFTGHFH